MARDEHAARLEARIRRQRRWLFVLAAVAMGTAVASVGWLLTHANEVADLRASEATLQGECESLAEHNMKLVNLIGMANDPLRRRQPVVKGRVLRADERWNRVRADIGRDDGVWPKDRFRVLRSGRPLGIVFAIEVAPDWMIGCFAPDIGTEGYPRAGDSILGGESSAVGR